MILSCRERGRGLGDGNALDFSPLLLSGFIPKEVRKSGRNDHTHSGRWLL